MKVFNYGSLFVLKQHEVAVTVLSGTGLALLVASKLSGFEMLFEKVLSIANKLETLVNLNIPVRAKDVDAFSVICKEVSTISFAVC